MIDTQGIKGRILSLAFSGKLFCSNPNEVNDAIESIHNTRKDYIPVEDSEHLIETPSNWKWSRLAYVSSNHGQMIPDEAFCYIDVGTMNNIKHCLASEEKIIQAHEAPSRARKIVEYGDVLYSTVRPYLHNICLIDKLFSRKPIASTAFCVMRANEDVIYNRFLYYWLLTAEFDKYSNGDPSKGALYPAIGEKDLLNGTIPLPSVKEQKAIVEIIDEAYATLDIIEDLQDQYNDNLLVLKNKLINAAIQGKMTEQLPEDGTAEELYQQIQQEKQKLEQEGKIKKSKPLPPVSDDEFPFEIPENWKWVRLNEIYNFIDYRGATPNKIDSGIPFVTAKNVRQGYLDYSVRDYISEEDYHNRQSRGISHKGDILFTTEAPMGYAAIADLERFSAGQRLITLQQYGDTDFLDNKYFVYSIAAEYFQKQLSDKCSGTTVKGIKADRLKQFLVLLPPLAEQKRIVLCLTGYLE